MRRLCSAEEKVRYWFRKYAIFLFVNVFLGGLVYFMLMSENLVNDMDGIWHTSSFVAGNWEISLGRGFQRYLDKMRFGVVSVPLNTIFTITLITIGNIFTLNLFNIMNQPMRLVLSLSLLANPVVCSSLTHSHLSVNLGIAYLFAVLAVYFIAGYSKGVGIVLGGGFIALSMGCYQAYIGVTCLMLLILWIKMMIDNVEGRVFVTFLVKSLLSVLLGGVFYLLLTYVLLQRAGVALASYKGASSISVLTMLYNLPKSIIHCYRQFFLFFTSSSYHTSIIMWLLGGVGVIVLGAISIQLVGRLKQYKWYVLGIIIGIVLIPVFSNAVLLIAVGNEATLLMAMGMMLSMVLPACFLPEGKIGLYLKKAYFLCMLVVVWVNIATVSNDQLALKEGKTATVTLADKIAGALISDGYLRDDYVVALIGRPAENHMFIQNAAYQRANGYARFGCWSTEAANHRRSWLGVLSEYCGLRLELCTEEQYNKLRLTDEVRGMPEFPLEGSMREIDGIVVVKVSELY